MIEMMMDPITLYSSVFILCVALLFAVKLWRSTKDLTKQLHYVNTELKLFKPKVPNDNDKVDEHEWSPSPLTIAYQNRDKMDAKIKATKCLATPWAAYQRSMQLPNVNFKLKPNQPPVLRNTMQVNTLFNMETIVETQINSRLFTSIPNILTGLGLLFTFVGLVFGIYNASLGLSSSDIDSAKEALNPLLKGASIAFITSIVGISCSMVFSLFEKIRFFTLEKEVKQFSDYLGTHIEFIDSDKLAAMQLEAIETQTNVLTRFQFEHQRITDETITRVSKEFRDTLLDKAGSELKYLTDLIAELNKSMSDNLTSFTENQIKVGNATEQLTKSLHESMLQMTDQISDSVEQMGLREETRTKNIYTTFENIFENISKIITNSSTDIAESLFEQSKLTIVNMSQASELFNQTMNESVKEFENLPSKITQASEQSIQHSSNQLKGLMEQLLPNIIEKVTESLDHQVSSFIKQISAAENNIAELLHTFPVVVTQLSKLNTELVENARVISSINDSSVKSLTNFAETSNSFNQSVSNMTEVNNSSAEIAKRYHDLLIGVQDAVKNASDFSQSSAQTAVKLKQALSEHSNVGKGIKSAIESSLEKLHTGLSDYANLTNKHMSSLDRDSSKVAAHLVEAIKEIDLLVKDIARSNSRLSGVA